MAELETGGVEEVRARGDRWKEASGRSNRSGGGALRGGEEWWGREIGVVRGYRFKAWARELGWQNVQELNPATPGRSTHR